MTRWTSLALLAALAACGGRTTLDDSLTGKDASATNDGGIIVQDGGIILDSGFPPPDASPPPFDGGPPPPLDAGGPGGPISCGNGVCNSATETCCVTYNGQSLSQTCTPIGSCQGATFDCSSASSCPPGDVCCAQFSQQSQSASCQPACQGGFQNPQLCASTAECPQGTTCKPTPFGFNVCRP